MADVYSSILGLHFSFFQFANRVAKLGKGFRGPGEGADLGVMQSVTGPISVDDSWPMAGGNHQMASRMG